MLRENINKVSSLSATAREGNVFIGMCQSFCSQRCRTDPHGGRPTLPVLTSSCCHCSSLVHILLECILVLKGNCPLPFLLTLHVSFTKKIKVVCTHNLQVVKAYFSKCSNPAGHALPYWQHESLVTRLYQIKLIIGEILFIPRLD